MAVTNLTATVNKVCGCKCNWQYGYPCGDALPCPCCLPPGICVEISGFPTNDCHDPNGRYYIPRTVLSGIPQAGYGELYYYFPNDTPAFPDANCFGTPPTSQCIRSYIVIALDCTEVSGGGVGGGPLRRFRWELISYCIKRGLVSYTKITQGSYAVSNSETQCSPFVLDFEAEARDNFTNALEGTYRVRITSGPCEFGVGAGGSGVVGLMAVDGGVVEILSVSEPQSFYSKSPTATSYSLPTPSLKKGCGCGPKSDWTKQAEAYLREKHRRK